MHEFISSLDGLFFGLSGYYSTALFTLFLSVIIALFFAHIFKAETELEDEGLGADEDRVEDDPKIQSQMRARQQQQNDIDDDEAYEEDEEALSESETEQMKSPPIKSPFYYNNLLGKFKARRYQHKLEKNLTPEQLDEERRVQREQLSAIFELLRKQEVEMNVKGLSERDLKEQVRLYR